MTRPKKKPLRKRFYNIHTLRRVVQITSFAAFIYLFALTIGRVTDDARLALVSAAPVDFFLRIDPLVGLSTMLGARKFIAVLLIYGLPLVILTILSGRFFCGWICPLGATLDAADALFYRSHGRNAGARQPYLNLKYYLLFAVLVTAIFSAQAAYLFDPIVIITRALTFAIYGPVQLAVRAMGGFDNRFFYDHQFFYRMNLVFFLIFAGIIAANAVSRRFWCRNLCPLGALLGLISRFSIIKRLVGDSCRDCGRCQKECKMAAICDDPRDYIAPECIYCYSCTKSCPPRATKIVPNAALRQAQGGGVRNAELLSPSPLAGEGRGEGAGDYNLNRRRTLQAFGIGITWAALMKTDWGSKTARTSTTKLSSPQLIRPPGSLPEPEFLDRCIRCGECMKVCPTNGLQPALAEAGIEGLWSPVLVPRIGECVQSCNLCRQVCPTQAIQPFEIEDKTFIFMGTAVIDRSACIAWNSDKACLVCDEYCSYHAVQWKDVDGIRRPFVDEKKCTGCGICENACPIQPKAAIRVFSFGDKRGMTREEQRRWSSTRA